MSSVLSFSRRTPGGGAPCQYHMCTPDTPMGEGQLQQIVPDPPWICPALVERNWLIWRHVFRTEPGWHLDGVDAPRRHRCAKVAVLNNHHRGGVHGPG